MTDTVDLLTNTFERIPDALDQPYLDFASVVNEVQTAEEDGAALSSNSLPENYDITDLDGMEYGFEASADYGDAEISLKYREKDRGMFSTEELARFNIDLEIDEGEDLSYSTFWDL